jgi:catechol 2,3-dioxygenase-like lactoylglutathione lyase family enzyme
MLGSYRLVVLIRHLALTVRDARTSRDFYLNTIGLNGEATEESWGVRIKFADEFMFALIQGEPLPESATGAVHFGCRLASRDEARDMRTRLRAAGVTEVEWEDEGDYTGVKVQDPDGYVVELAYDEA